jgi:hypothetical protein
MDRGTAAVALVIAGILVGLTFWSAAFLLGVSMLL